MRERQARGGGELETAAPLLGVTPKGCCPRAGVHAASWGPGGEEAGGDRKPEKRGLLAVWLQLLS